MAVTWPKTTARMLTEVTGESRPDVAMLLVLKDAIAHRLEQIALAQTRFEAKYGMTFEEYKKHWETEDKSEYYSYEAEFDYLEWEALDTRKVRLEGVQAWLT
ncbi:MAG: hypothetical protein HY868_12345 [Chloroflexi bacterium]|nr:hypothetical protein [Chloroflexota bacterium]